MTRSASKRLFEKASTPHDLIALGESQIAKLIFPVGFYRTKAKTLIALCKKLLDDYDAKVPDDLDELLKLKGVGRKTANLVITLGFGKLGVCVDTHVHRISNRLGYVETKTAEQTEMVLREKLPKDYWIEYNDLLVTWGQNIANLYHRSVQNALSAPIVTASVSPRADDSLVQIKSLFILDHLLKKRRLRINCFEKKGFFWALNVWTLKLTK